MSEINYAHNSRTIGQVVVACLFSTQLLSLPIDTLANDGEPLSHGSYVCGGNQGTYDRFTAPLSAESEVVSDSFEEIVSIFYSHLLSKQEALGAEFGKILQDNRWNLYER